MSDDRKIVSYGGGTNSTALLVGLYERGERPEAILFADTGGEKPNTYKHIEIVNEWCKKIGFPEIITVKAPNLSLEEDCLKRKALPSVAYGFKTCSQRWKKQPQDKYLNQHGMKDAVRLIGIDAGEEHRAKDYENVRYPLIEWEWDRDDCIAAIKRAGLPQPGKSSCFFCPNSKAHEIISLSDDLKERAIRMERNAELTSLKGLGRTWRWEDLIRADREQMDMFKCNSEMPCECYDG